MTTLNAIVGGAATSSSGVTRYHLIADVPGVKTSLLAEIDVMTMDWSGIDEEGEEIHYWDPPREDEPYSVHDALVTLYWFGESPTNRTDWWVWKKFDSLWDAICGVAEFYGWDLEVIGYPEEEEV